MTTSPSRVGRYVVIEGNDGTGKSTQVELLAKFLNEQGIGTFVMHEPAGTPIADAIRTVIKDGELERDGHTNLLLFTAARHELWLKGRLALDSGDWVISARNYLSTEVYQGLGEGLSVETIHALTRQFTDDRYMSPDHMFVLTLTDEERIRRIESRGALTGKDTFESRGNDFQQALNQGYVDLAKRYGFTTIDASQTVDEIQAQIRRITDGDIRQNTDS